jgi:hypothetical protein
LEFGSRNAQVGKGVEGKMKEGEKFRWREGKIRPGQKGKMVFVIGYSWILQGDHWIPGF